ncbi:stage II sporulation protein R [Herbinix luporum]|uniref:stage II sporulation protein R n=1 Tax=Herbinix luporum TaxID=1679721 RepID=UPI001752773A|nr:stage II sporulation protein R [Herbinix luporum]MDI9489611.1 stage II sporulation protein R [Bacillota bacterium]HHT57625.1 stage II sporulation protein R [Herbinix luporum]
MKNKINKRLRRKDLHNKAYTDKNNNRIRVFFLLALLIISYTLTQILHLYKSKPSRLQEEIAKEIIRFHVVANSDSDEDQNLKYQVKDAVLKTLYPYLKDVDNINHARAILKEKLPLIEEVASKVIKDKGYTYSVLASYSNCYFPLKVYGDYTFPPGTYQAVQVKIGKAQGKNWWCVMFPPLCFVDETYSIVSSESEKKLSFLLTDEELDALKTKRLPVKVKFKLFAALKNLFC